VQIAKSNAGNFFKGTLSNDLQQIGRQMHLEPVSHTHFR